LGGRIEGRGRGTVARAARELGLPAVVNVKQGTKVIKTGQRITVDGARGIVTIEE